AHEIVISPVDVPSGGIVDDRSNHFAHLLDGVQQGGDVLGQLYVVCFMDTLLVSIPYGRDFGVGEGHDVTSLPSMMAATARSSASSSISAWLPIAPPLIVSGMSQP